jgi:hypothetical protein
VPSMSTDTSTLVSFVVRATLADRPIDRDDSV